MDRSQKRSSSWFYPRQKYVLPYIQELVNLSLSWLTIFETLKLHLFVSISEMVAYLAILFAAAICTKFK